MNFMVYDLVLLGIFLVFTSIFLYLKRKNLKREGLLFLYKTSLGIKLINHVGKKYKKTLEILGYISIALGFILMGTMIYLFGRIVWIYIFQADLIRMVKVPPVMPLIPYLPQLFKLSFLPPFYFTYWIIIIAVVAIFHEFSHGIFAAHKKIKIKSTGFGFFPFFLPVFLAAFVELDEKRMAKKKILPQMTVLSSGTFANILTGILFFLILFGFFSLAFVPSGVVFDTYTYSIVGISAITSVNDVLLANPSYESVLDALDEKGINEIKTEDSTYLTTKSFLEQQKNSEKYVFLYYDAPAIKSQLESIIIKVNGISVKNRDEMGEELLRYSPGKEITITTLSGKQEKTYNVVLGKNPDNETSPYLGVGFMNRKEGGFMYKIATVLSSFKNPNVYYKPAFAAAEFIYDLLWWLVLICFSVALVNMLPVGIFDGGRFFYLTVLGITKKESIAKKAFSIMTYIFLALLAVIMIFWAINMFG